MVTELATARVYLQSCKPQASLSRYVQVDRVFDLFSLSNAKQSTYSASRLAGIDTYPASIVLLNY